MKLNILAFAASASAASVQLFKNYCLENKTITLNYPDHEDMNQQFALPSGQAWLANIAGLGNTAIVSNDPDIFSEDVGKLILGTSTESNVLYWNLNNANGDPFEGQNFNVTSNGSEADICQHANSYSSDVHACSDEDVTLTLNLCSQVPAA